MAFLPKALVSGMYMYGGPRTETIVLRPDIYSAGWRPDNLFLHFCRTDYLFLKSSKPPAPYFQVWQSIYLNKLYICIVTYMLLWISRFCVARRPSCSTYFNLKKENKYITNTTVSYLVYMTVSDDHFSYLAWPFDVSSNA